MSRNKVAILVLVVGFIALVVTGMIQIPGMPDFGAIVAKIPIIGGLLNGQSAGPTGPSFGNIGGGNPLFGFLKSRWGVMLIIVGLLAIFRSRIPVLDRMSGWPLVIALLVLAWIATGLIPGMGGMNPVDVIRGLVVNQLLGKLQSLLPGQGGGKLPSISGPGISIDSFKSIDGLKGLIGQYWWVLLALGGIFLLYRSGRISGKMALIVLVVAVVGGKMMLGGGFNMNLAGIKLGGQSSGQQGGCRAYHTVKPGEGLWRIGTYYGTTAAAIAAANGNRNVNTAWAGETLCIP